MSSLPDIDGDGVPDDADDCPGTPDWITLRQRPQQRWALPDGVLRPVGAQTRSYGLAATTADIPKIDVYFLIDATPTLAEEIRVLQAEILNIIDDVRVNLPGRPVRSRAVSRVSAGSACGAHSQAPYHHILDLTDDEVLVQAAVSTLNTVANATAASAATQALYSVASGLGLGDMVPNRGSCPNAPDADVGYPCFRAEALHVVMNITDAEVYNGPRPIGPEYDDEGFAPGAVAGVDTCLRSRCSPRFSRPIAPRCRWISVTSPASR